MAEVDLLVHPIFLDGGQTVAEVQQIPAPDGAEAVVVRVLSQGEPLWFLLSVPEVGRRLCGGVPEAQLLDVLDLNSRQLIGAVSREDLAGIEAETPLVVLADGEPVGLYVPDVGRPLRAFMSDGVAMAAPPSFEPEGPPVNVYSRLMCPAEVEAGETFDLCVGLSAAAVAGSEGRPFALPAPEADGLVRLEVLVLAHGFTAQGDQWLFPLPVNPADLAKAEVAVALTAEPGPEQRSLRVHYRYKGQVIGRAYRNITVWPAAAPGAHSVAVAAPSVAPPAPTATGGGRVNPAIAEHPADITLHIELESEDRNLFWCYIETPYAGLNGAPLNSQLRRLREADSKRFAQVVVEAIEAKKRGPKFDEDLAGLGDLIAELLGSAVWQTIRAVADHVQSTFHRVPTLLLATSEFNIPWELASFKWDPDRPPVLGAQLSMGRQYWPLNAEDDGVDQLELKIPIQSMTVVWSDYADSSSPLPKAKDEAQLLGKFGAVSVTADEQGIDQALKHTAPLDLLHFACHGVVKQSLASGSIVLAGGTDLSALRVRAARETLEQVRPFVFLNACQVGQPIELLGVNVGVAASFLAVGARACIAPLWSINDVDAKEMVEFFYTRTLDPAQPMTVGEALREVRARFRTAEGLRHTFMAYVYYGHPNLVLTKA